MCNIEESRVGGDHLPDELVAVGELRLPKFKMTFSGSIKEVLMDDLGIQAAFDAEEADLSGMGKRDDAPGLPLFVQGACHRAVIEVNEEGTEAAAVTVFDLEVGACRSRTPPTTVDFIADHPFVFFVVEEVSGAIMFIGHVRNPSMTG